jgi:malate dehydrogenase
MIHALEALDFVENPIGKISSRKEKTAQTFCMFPSFCDRYVRRDFLSEIWNSIELLNCAGGWLPHPVGVATRMMTAKNTTLRYKKCRPRGKGNSMTTPIRIAVTGAAGQIGYSLIFRIAAGEVFGRNQPVILHLIEIPQAMAGLEGIHMELDDCAFPTLAGVVKADSDHLDQALKDTNYVVCVGSIPRKQGMERGDLIRINGPIFTSTGRAIEEAAAGDVRVLVVGNPCNTNCLIAMNNAPNVPRDRWYAMTRLDENRAVSQLALKARRPVSSVTGMAIWGNHSATQFPDFYHTRIDGKSALKAIGDENWLKNDFLSIVQQRGAAVIKARGASSAASAANAIIDSLRSISCPTPAGTCFSAAVCSDGSYGVDAALISSFPLTSDGKTWSIVKGIEHNEFALEKLKATVAELRDERKTVEDLLKK